MSQSIPSPAPPVTARPDLLGLSETAWRLLVAGGVSLVALALRWPYLLLVPRLTDETAEIKFALRIFQGEILPLTHTDPYNGPIHPYILALLFRVFGLEPIIPRAMVAVLGAALAGVLAWLAWGMARQVVQKAESGKHATRAESSGSTVSDPLPAAYRLLPSAPVACLLPALVAGGLMATSFPHILVNSHIAWSSCMTPLFTTVALGVTWAAVVRTRAGLLVLAGFLWGLAWQTHPSVVALLPGVALWIVLHPTGRRWLRSPWPYLALAAFLLGYGNMIWYNLTQSAASVDEALNSSNAYTVAPSLSVYAGNVGALALQLARMLAGSFFIDDTGLVPTMASVAVPVYGAVALAALVWAARRIETAILTLAALSAALILPIVSYAFVALHDTRYIAFLLPLVYLAIGLAAGRLITDECAASRRDRRVRSLPQGPTSAQPPAETDDGQLLPIIGRLSSVVRRPWPQLTLLLGLAVLVVWPLIPLWQYYADSEAQGLTNTRLIALAQAADKDATQGAHVLLDREMRKLKLGGGGDPVRAIEYLLVVEQTPHEIARPETINWFLLNSEAPLFLVVADDTYTMLTEQGHILAPTPHSGDGFAVYTAPPAKK